MIFVDTGAWFARFVPKDPDYPTARDWFDRNSRPLLTTDYFVDELLPGADHPVPPVFQALICLNGSVVNE
jgi:predicted nucleic acid-binding protein